MTVQRAFFARLFLSLYLFVVFFGVSAQESSEVAVKTEIFLVNQTTDANGSVQEDLKPATEARPGQIVEYRLTARNETDTTLPAGAVSITGPVPDGTSFVADSATPTDERISTEYSTDGQAFADTTPTGANQTFKAIRWTLLVALEPGQEETFVYRVTVDQTTN
jgi:uncharacterized repeat protein (TIGR01451 family)